MKFITHNGAARQLRSGRPGIQSFGRIDIADDSFIGENAILLPGTSIGRNCIIAAGAVVHGLIPDNSLVVGNPARIVGRASLYLSDNAYIEAFNGRFRAECLNAHWFLTLADAAEKMEDWRIYYNEERPHGAIGHKVPISLINPDGVASPPSP